ncbi:amino acid adenylation domain-containing protein [Kitasatospora sp. NPDC056327]|uniref:amino acid adenylation domain-containing protein n=1 Tax=Kitasatospora sp. NPDC056327 TaxID=3345785 RepID=UPI0035D787A4
MSGSRTPGPTTLAGPVRPVAADSVVGLVHRHARERPDAPALIHGPETWSFGRLWRRTLELAAGLAEAGVTEGGRVVLWADRSPSVVAAALAVMALRAAYVPVDPAFPAQRVEAVVAGSDPVLLLHDGAADTIQPPPLPVARLDVAELPAPRAVPLPEPPRAGDIAYVIFTSGSTGVPKGVLVEHGSLVNYALWCAAMTGLADGAAGPGEGGSPLFGSLGFDHAVTSLWPALAVGRPVTLLAGVWDQRTLFAARPRPYTLLKVTPSHLRFFERTARPAYHGATRLLMFGGEALDPALIASAGERLAGVRLMNHYGPTEATVGCCFNEFDPEAVRGLPSVPIGRPIWNTRAYLVDEQLRPARPGRPAELVIAGAGVAAGYLGRPAGDPFLDEAELGGPAGRAYRTGDRVELLPDGTLLYLGRADSQLKVSGYRVELGELRRHALAVPGVGDVAFDIVAGAVESLEAYLVLDGAGAVRTDGETAVREVRRALAAALPPALVPRRVLAVPELVLNVNGKCDIAATRAAAARAGAAPGPVPPGSAVPPPPGPSLPSPSEERV